MSKPNSSLTTAISIRLPNDLLQSISELAVEEGFINTVGRSDKRGQPNLSAAIAELLRQALLHAANGKPPESNEKREVPVAWREELAALEERLLTRIAECVAVQMPEAARSDRPVAEPVEEVKVASVESTSDDTRTRIQKAIGRGFRSRGYHGIGVDSLAKSAGVTSGAFYGYFHSKEDAFLEAVVDGLREYRLAIENFRATSGEKWTEALADYYVGLDHRKNIACGCALPTLSPEVIRAGDRVRTAYQKELIGLHAAIAAGLHFATESENHDRAWVLLALLSGGLTLARAVRDEALSARIAAAVHEGAIACVR